MARTPDDAFHGQADSHSATTLDASSGGTLTLPGSASVNDLDMLRDGHDLVLRAPNGQETIVENYFSADPAPVIISADGSALTPALVDSFSQPIDGVQYAQKGSVDDASPVGVVKEVSGEATITHENGMVVKAAIGTPIYEGDIVETKGDGAVNITFIDDTTFAVSQNARLAIDEYVFDPATQSGENNFSVLRGVFVFTSGLIGREDPDDVKIETPVGSIGIRGTTIMGDINPDGESQITVVEGAIVVKNGQGEQTLSQQFETVKLTGFNNPISDPSVLDSKQIGEDYTVVRTVSAPLFSTFDDMATTDAPADQAPAEGEDAPAQTAPADENTAPATDPVNKTEAAPADATTTTEALAEPALDTSLEQASFDSGFDTSAGIAGTSAFDSPSTAATTTSANNTPSTATASSQTVSPVVVTAAAGTTTPTTDTTIAAPPSVLDNASSTGTNTTSGGTVTPTPPTVGTIDLNLNTVISTSVGGRYIPSIAAGSRHGEEVIALGDVDKDGFMDYAFISHNPTGGRVYIDDTRGNQHEVQLNNTPYNLNDTTHLQIASVGDFNGDGFGDIVIGSSLADDAGQINSGKIVIMNAADPTTAMATTITGFNAGQFAGYSVAGGGDFNGDGYNDIIIGAPYDSGIGKTYIIFGNPNASTININGLSPSQGLVITGQTAMQMGSDVANIGDFNKDGYSDIATSSPGLGQVQVYFGNANNTLSTPMTITGLTSQTGDNGIPVIGMGDMNGDGAADFAVTDLGTNTLHVFFGGAFGAGTYNAYSSNLKITATAGSEILSGGSAGDFNGDGYDDGVVAIRTGSSVDIYVFYGKAGTVGTLDLATAPDSSVFKMTLDLSSAQFGFANPAIEDPGLTFSSAGDLDGDGFDDLLIGIPTLGGNNGGVIIVNGRAEADALSSGSVQLSNIATAANQSLLGGAGADLMQSAFNNVHMSGGSGNDTLQVDGGILRGADGGTGVDMLKFMQAGANIDLRNLGENLTAIEQINLGNSSQSLTIGIDQIFRLLQESETGDLTFSSVNPGGQLSIDNNGNGSVNLTDLGFTATTPVGALDAWQFGEYTLYIDTNTNVTVANV
jgi:hypothetical protein